MRILFITNNAAFFVSHRMPIAVAALRRGDDVILATGTAGSATLESPALEELRKAGIAHTLVQFSTGGVNPLLELQGLLQLLALMRRWQPDVVHCASPKGVLYGGIAAFWARVPGLVLSISGQGYVYTDDPRRAGSGRRMLRAIYTLLARQAYRHRRKRVIVQNQDDLSLILSHGLAQPEEVVLIPGSGVPLEPYLSITSECRERLVVLPARMLKDKGVAEFVDAARSLRREGCDWTFALVGTADYQNPSALSELQIHQWESEGIVQWWGHCADMLEVYRRARIVCLPSYREGMPKVLLEAAAAGCAVVTTDVVGCREAVLAGVSGDLVPVADPAVLADALRLLIADPARADRYGKAGRRLAIERFDLREVVRQVLALYDGLHDART